MSTDTPTRRSSTTLAQIVAIVPGTKTRTDKALTAAYHTAQRAAAFNGLSRTHRKRFDDGEDMPSESTLVQARADDLIADVCGAMSRMLDVIATQEWANTTSRGSIVIEGETLLADVPVTYLMWLEKQIVLLRSFVAKLPVLDVSETWTFDPDTRLYENAGTETARTKKMPRNHTKAPATDKHAAQVEMWMEDVVVGYWTTTKTSGALPGSRVFELAGRIEQLLDAIRIAREEANEVRVADVDAGAALLDFLFH